MHLKRSLSYQTVWKGLHWPLPVVAVLNTRLAELRRVVKGRVGDPPYLQRPERIGGVDA